MDATAENSAGVTPDVKDHAASPQRGRAAADDPGQETRRATTEALQALQQAILTLQERLDGVVQQLNSMTSAETV